MKLFVLSLLLFSFSTPSFAATVNGAFYKNSTRTIEVNVTYGGGCKEHTFVLRMGSCMESYPVRCQAALVDLTTDDFCEALISQTVSLPIDSYGLGDEYYNGASITITGDANSRATLVLPRK